MNKQFIIFFLSVIFLFNLNAGINQQTIAPENSDAEKSKKTSKLKFWGKKKKKEKDSTPIKNPEIIKDSVNINNNLDDIINNNESTLEIMVDSIGIFDNHKIKKDFLQLRQSTLDLMNFDEVNNEIELITYLYDLNKRTNALEQEFITKTLGDIGDDTVIPILIEIANNNNLPLEIRSNAVEILSKKQANELVDFLNAMLGDPHSISKVNEFALNVMGDLSEERMIMALLESYKMGRSKYYSLLNTIMNSLDNFENPEIVSIYKEIANTKEFPSKIRLQAFKSLIRFSDEPNAIDQIIELLNDPYNYKYHEEIISLLQNSGKYEQHKTKLRMAAFKAMQNEVSPLDKQNE